MKLVLLDGYVYRLTERAYQLVLVRIKHDRPMELDALGEKIGGIDKDLSTMQAGDAAMELDWMKAQKTED